MGNFFQGKPTGEYDKSLVMFLKQKTLAQLKECQKYVLEEYVGVNTFIFDEYKDVFGGVLNERIEQMFLIIQNQHDKNGRIDVYESFASIALFCGDEYEPKAKFLYQMFDFNKTLQLEQKELVMIFQTSIRALCKMVLIIPPNLTVIEEFANQLFAQIDENKDYSINEREFYQFLEKNDELQDFLLQYARVQSYANSARKTKQIHEKFLEIWKQCAGEEAHECEPDPLFLALKNVITKEEEFQALTNLLSSTSHSYKGILQDQETQNVIHQAVFSELMLAQSAFEATDIQNDGKISLFELRFIIYAYEGKILENEQQLAKIKELDKDQSGEMSKQEWFDYLSLSEGDGAPIFKGELRRHFATHDLDKNGQLSLDEVKSLVKTVVGRRARKKEVLDMLVGKIFEEIDKNKDGVLGWDEFKQLDLSWLKA